jgi:hypothetical protein
MPKAACPACKTEVKYPRDAEPGTELTCPECEEVFVPPELKAVAKAKKAYDPEEDEDVYRAERPIADLDRERKAKRVAAATHHAARRARSESATRRKAWFEGPEVWLLIFAVGAGGGLPFGFWLARNWEQMGSAKFFWIMVGMVALFMVALGLGGSAWAWLRKNR